MSEQTNEKAMIVQSVDEVNVRARALAQRIKYMIQNGARLKDEEVWALAQYSAATDLNPFAQECYYLPGVGPTAGIAGWRRKAQEQLVFEAEKAGKQWAEFTVLFYLPEEGEVSYDRTKGDIAVKASLKDTLSSSLWRRELFDAAERLQKLGVQNALEAARELVGPEPEWTGVAVVYGSESFSFGNKPEKFDRGERCNKRAEKLAIKKRFPRIHLPEPEEADVASAPLDFSVETPAEPRLSPGPKRSEVQLLDELGFGEEKPVPSQEVPAASVTQVDQDPAMAEDWAIFNAVHDEFTKLTGNTMLINAGWSTGEIRGAVAHMRQAIAEGKTKKANAPVAMLNLVYGARKLGSLSIDELTVLIENKQAAASLREAAKIVREYKIEGQVHNGTG